ncbi:TNR6 factor, partial [Scytalopus superciliaris]|nr:TNR6 factor [Scytalopus superciliaris]
GFVKIISITCPTDINEHCVLCESGKEFINYPNDLNKCKRCSSCDRVFGLEVAKNCTPEEDTECACIKDHFCNISSVPCGHCNPCTNEDSFGRNCITAKDLPSSRTSPNTILRKTGMCKGKPAMCLPSALISFLLLDIDLSSHIAGIVEEMTYQQVLAFVRHHHIQEPTIDQITRDCPGDTSEQKIRLFRTWYQHHGMKGVYGTLISSLRQLKMCAAADKIEEKLKPAVSSCQEGRQSYNGDTEQS